MTTINLLDWREKRRQVENNKFFVIVGVAVIMCAIFAWTIDVVIDTLIDGKVADIAYIASEEAAIEGKITEVNDLEEQKKTLLQRRDVVATLQDSRSLVVKIFDNIPRVIPSDVVLISITKKNDQLTLSGNAASNTAISTLMKNIQMLKWVKAATLNAITAADTSGSKAAPGSNQTSFEITIDLVATGVVPSTNTKNTTPTKGTAAPTGAGGTTPQGPTAPGPAARGGRN